MKRFFSILAFVLSLGSVAAQKTIHDPNVVLRDVESFHSIEVSGGVDLYLSQGDQAVAISARDAKSRDRVKTEVKNGVLKIWYQWAEGVKINLGNSPSIKAYVSAKTLEKLVATGGVDVSIEGVFKTKSLSIKLTGGVDLKGKLDVEDLKMEQTGGTDAVLSGSATNFYISAVGGSDFKGYGLTTQYCHAEASGASDISITVTKEISAEASGASDVNWKGTATIKKARSSGAGTVSHRS